VFNLLKLKTLKTLKKCSALKPKTQAALAMQVFRSTPLPIEAAG
jgi:hypothetical protein